MKNIYTFLSLMAIILFAFGQSIEGTWVVTPEAGAIGVGPTMGDTGWWSISAADVTTRACYFDDVIQL